MSSILNTLVRATGIAAMPRCTALLKNVVFPTTFQVTSLVRSSMPTSRALPPGWTCRPRVARLFRLLYRRSSTGAALRTLRVDPDPTLLSGPPSQADFKAVQGHRTPGRCARSEGERRAARFWSAAALRRFGSFGRTRPKASGAAYRLDTASASEQENLATKSRVHFPARRCRISERTSVPAKPACEMSGPGVYGESDWMQSWTP
jgi:hypothetical protein